MSAVSISKILLTFVGIASFATASHAAPSKTRAKAPLFMAEIATSSSDYRSGARIVGSLSANKPFVKWSFENSSDGLDMALLKGDEVSGIAPAVAVPTELWLSGTAATDNETAGANVLLTVHPKLAIAGGPSGKVLAAMGKAYPAQPAYSVVGLVGNPSYALMQNGSVIDLPSRCPGLLFLGDGVISGSPAAACDLKGLKVRIADSFDAAMSEGASFDIAVAPLTASLPAGGENFAERAQRDRRL